MPTMLKKGQRLGAYEIVRQLDRGGMGIVYEAIHVALGTRCAVKVFAPESQRQDFLRKRFLTEGKLLAEFRHPNIVRVTDLQVDPASGTPYFAMDLVLSPDGEPRTLEAARTSGIDEGQIVGWMRDICGGLAYIHGRGVVHRDISLENVLVGPDGHAVITDFGISRIFDKGLREHVDLTRFTTVELGSAQLKIGKAFYLAPELKRKRPAHASPASDAYALGILLYRLLVSSWFERENRQSLPKMLAGMDYDWAPLLNRLLADRRSERLPTGGIAAIPDLLKPVKPPSDRKRILVFVAIGVVVAAAVAGGIAWASRRGPGRPIPPRATPTNHVNKATLNKLRWALQHNAPQLIHGNPD